MNFLSTFSHFFVVQNLWRYIGLVAEQALSFLWHNVGKDAMLVALNKLGGFNKDRTLNFQMVIIIYQRSMKHCTYLHHTLHDIQGGHITYRERCMQAA